MTKQLHIGYVIQMIRQGKNMKQSELAAKINKSTSMVSVIERTGKVKDSVLMAIAKALNTTPEAIMNYNRQSENDILKDYYELKENYNNALNEIKSLKRQMEDKDKIISLLERVVKK